MSRAGSRSFWRHIIVTVVVSVFGVLAAELVAIAFIAKAIDQ